MKALAKQYPCFAVNLCNLRKKAKLSQGDISKSIEVDRSTYAKWEKGASEPSLCMISKIIDFYSNLNLDVVVDFNFLLSERNEEI